MLISAIKLWLNKYIRFIEWGVLLVSWFAVGFAVHHYDNLTVKADRVDAAEAKIKVVHDVKIIRDKVHSMPDASIDNGLRDWYRD